MIFNQTVHNLGSPLSLRMSARRNFSFTPQSSTNLVQNFEVNFGSLSDTILSGIPWCLTKLHKNGFATSTAESESFYRIKWTLSGNKSTFVVILSHLLFFWKLHNEITCNRTPSSKRSFWNSWFCDLFLHVVFLLLAYQAISEIIFNISGLVLPMVVSKSREIFKVSKMTCISCIMC